MFHRHVLGQLEDAKDEKIASEVAGFFIFLGQIRKQKKPNQTFFFPASLERAICTQIRALALIPEGL